MNMLQYRAEQKEMLDFWMSMRGYPVLNEPDIEKLFGGVGDNRPMSMFDATCEDRAGSYPYRWFKCNDDSFYQEPEYVYTNWYESTRFSHWTYGVACATLTHPTFVDICGTAFSAEYILKMSPIANSVWVFNFGNSVAADFARWYVKQKKLNVNFTDDSTYLMNPKYSYVMSESLEHFYNATEFMEKWIGAKTIVMSNSFCTFAPGHQVPVEIDGVKYFTRIAADKAFLEWMNKKNYNVEVAPHLRKKVLICRLES